MTAPDAGPTEVRDRRVIERGPGYRSGLRDLPRNLNVSTIGAAVVAAVFGCTGPALIIINGAEKAGLSPTATASWIFGVYVFGGLNSLLLALYYKQPIVGAWSIPGAVLVVDALGTYSLSELVGAYLVTSLLVILAALTGVVRRVMSWLPFPIVMAMIAGALIKFAISVVESGTATPWIVAAAVLGYLVFARFVRKIPGVVGALVAGIMVAAVTGGFSGAGFDGGLTAPELVLPTFDAGAVLAVSIPLAILVLGAENAQAIGTLMAADYRPPVNSMSLLSGVSGALAAAFGGHTANIAGPMTAICTSRDAGPTEGRYAASVLNGTIFMAFGLLSGAAVAVVTALPSELVAAVAGLAMITVLLSAFQGAFRASRFQVGSLFALVIAMSGVSILGISSPFWALIGGVGASLLLERDHFGDRAQQPATK
ncbi:benzoate/H(+) symporter BenE family transporter [Saccharomonospora sp. NPDC006951]